MGDAGLLLNLVTDGRAEEVRAALMKLGGTELGPLPPGDEVRVSEKLNRPVLYLPRGLEGFPSPGT